MANVKRFAAPAIAAACLTVTMRFLVDALSNSVGAGVATVLNLLYRTTHPDRTPIAITLWSFRRIFQTGMDAAITLVVGLLIGWLVLRRARAQAQ